MSGQAAPRVADAWTDLPIGEPLPRVCVKCAATADLVERVHTFTWTPRDKQRSILLFGALFGALGGLLAGATNSAHQRIVSLTLPICRRCNAKWRSSNLCAHGTVLTLVLVLIATVSSATDGLGPDVILAMLIGSVLAVVAARYYAKRSALTTERIERRVVTVSGVAEAARPHFVRGQATMAR